MRYNKKILFSVLFLILVLIFVYNIKNTENFTIGASRGKKKKERQSRLKKAKSIFKSLPRISPSIFSKKRRNMVKFNRTRKTEINKEIEELGTTSRVSNMKAMLEIRQALYQVPGDEALFREKLGGSDPAEVVREAQKIAESQEKRRAQRAAEARDYKIRAKALLEPGSIRGGLSKTLLATGTLALPRTIPEIEEYEF